ncbi:unnamed protein product [Rotaria socialis]|uniref:Uncharacterized protein n=1 Tax=Rotaria socialis TaxID=392032 RepID=A0A820UHH2_9BILA|nr:unnamed protein product [Rotaria socialis]
MFRRNFSFPHQNNAQICQNTSDYQSCSSNIACGCFPLVSNDDQGICAHLHLKCSTLSVCAANNQTCFAPGHVCVKHSRCQSRPLCYPVHMASQHICPTPVLTTTTIAPLVPNDGICVTATWNPNGFSSAAHDIRFSWDCVKCHYTKMYLYRSDSQGTHFILLLTTRLRVY